jgi:hypothetical protein
VSNQLNIFDEQHKAKCKAYREVFYRGVKARYEREKKEWEMKDLTLISIKINPKK